MAFFTPLENFARDNAKDIPLIRNIDEKLGVKTRRILLVVLLLLFVLLLVMLLVSAFKPKQDSRKKA